MFTKGQDDFFPELGPLTTPSDLAFLLGTELPKLNYMLYVIGVDSQYTDFTIDKKNGDKRVISKPSRRLSILQSRMKPLLENLYRPSAAASAFIKGRGIVHNAKKHVKKNVVFNVDLKDFFGSINFGRVYGLLKAKPYSLNSDVARIIAHLCCYNKVLPQGAPTSPVISNMICRKLDRDLSFLAKNNFCYYTRYADDITFSSHKVENNSIYSISSRQASEELIETVVSNGFIINSSKTRLQLFDERQVVTGLKVNRKINVDRRYVRKTRALIHELNLDVATANQKFKEISGDEAACLESVVHGRISYIGMVKGLESSVYQGLATKFNNIDTDIKVSLAPKDKNESLENQLHFYGYKNRARIESSVFVMTFEGVEGLDEDCQLVQGTAFLFEKGRIITASHTFSKAGDPSFCYLFKVRDPSVKYKAKLVWRCKGADIAELVFVDDKPSKLRGFDLSPTLEPHHGYMLSVVGFPEYTLSNSNVSIICCNVINTSIISTFFHADIDKNILAGNSGGPVLNSYMQLVGIAVRGATVSSDGRETNLEGTGKFVSAKHIPDKTIFSEEKEVEENENDKYFA